MNNKTLTIAQLYPKDMNIYGDWGNTLTLKRRIEWHGYTAQIIDYNPGDSFPQNADIIVGGGGQDSGQGAIQSDLLGIGPTLKELADSNVPMLMICGMYQLFGHYFKTRDGAMINGIGLFDMTTQGGPERLIGNIITKSDAFGEIIGYENHSGLTFLGKNTTPFGQVVHGAGNNGKDSTEGAMYKNVIGTYLHGSLLPKNPMVADWLIEKAAERKFGEFEPAIIDDLFAEKARAIAAGRPR